MRMPTLLAFLVALPAAAQDHPKNEIPWQTDWETAAKAARESNQPIFWLNIVGELAGNA